MAYPQPIKFKSKRSASGARRVMVLPVIFGVLLGAVVVLASYWASEQQRRSVLHDATLLSEQTALRMEKLLISHLAAGRHIQTSMEASARSEETAFRREARLYLDIFPVIDSISWLKPDGVFAWRVTRALSSQTPSDTVQARSENIDILGQVRDRDGIQISAAFDLTDGGRGFVITYPVAGPESGEGFPGETLPQLRRGYVHVALRVDRLMGLILDQGVTGRYGVRIANAAGEVYRQGGVGSADAGAAAGAGTGTTTGTRTGTVEVGGGQAEAGFDLAGQAWSVTLYPTAAAWSGQPRENALLILVIGLPLVVGLAALMWLFLMRHEALRASEALANAVIDNSPSALGIADVDGKYLRVNPQFSARLGRVSAQSDDVSAPASESLSGLAPLAEEERRVLEKGQLSIRERQDEAPDGEIRHAIVARFPIWDAIGNLVAVGTNITDISDQKKAENALRDARDQLEDRVVERTRELEEEVRERRDAERSLRHSEERFRDIARAASDWFWETDADLRFTFISDRFFDLVSIPRAQVIGKACHEIPWFEKVGAVAEPAAQAASTLMIGEPFKNLEFSLKASDGTRHVVRLNGQPFTDEEGKFLGYRGAGTDVTVARQAQRALENAKSELELRVKSRTQELQEEITERRRAQEEADIANRAKTEFLAHMSHELRTPLNGIIGFAELLQHEVIGPLGDPKYREYAQDIHRSGSHLLEIISSLLDVSRIEAGALELHEEPLRMGAVINECFMMVKTRAEQKQLRLQSDVEPNLPRLFADGTRVKQILLNLLSNAVKFTADGGEIVVTARTSAARGIEFAVTDTGIGIAEEDIPEIIKPFGQVREAAFRAHEGTGLGLALVRALTESHGGHVRIESTLGEGTTVWVAFPSKRVFTPVVQNTGTAPVA